jgi:hypothetical protein
MTPWTNRSPEERALLNPSFFSLLFWHAATGHMEGGGTGLPFGTGFLVLPVVLHRETRESLPKMVTTSLPVWLDDNPLVRARLAERARTLVPYTREALLFGGTRGFLTVSEDRVLAEQGWKRKISADLRRSSDEVRSCAKRADFLGRWFARAGSPATVMALMGVRP